MTIWDTEKFFLVMRSEEVVGIFSTESEAEAVAAALDCARVVPCAEVESMEQSE